jgi:hypothetical protein
VQEPVGTVNVETKNNRRTYQFIATKRLPDGVLDVYTTPPAQPAQRTWVGLTNKEIDYIYTGIEAVHDEVDSDVLCRAIEAKLKQKNGYAKEKNT